MARVFEGIGCAAVGFEEPEYTVNERFLDSKEVADGFDREAFFVHDWYVSLQVIGDPVKWHGGFGMSLGGMGWWAKGYDLGLDLFVLKESWLIALVYFTRGTSGVLPGSRRERFLCLRFPHSIENRCNNYVDATTASAFAAA